MIQIKILGHTEMQVFGYCGFQKIPDTSTETGWSQDQFPERSAYSLQRTKYAFPHSSLASRVLATNLLPLTALGIRPAVLENAQGLEYRKVNFLQQGSR